MAGETRGELAEAIAKVALDMAGKLLRVPDQIFWHESPDGAVIAPDLTIGIDLKAPKVVVLVNTSDSPRNSDIKYWRNLAEIFDSKSRLTNRPSVLNLVFRSEIKPELIRLTAAVCDASCLVDRDPRFGAAIMAWLDANHAKAPKARDGKVELVRAAITKGDVAFEASFSKALGELAKHLSGLLFQQKSTLDPLWKLCQADFSSRKGRSVRAAKVTLLRRGLARWLVFDQSVREAVFSQHIKDGKVKIKTPIAYAEPLGMLKRRIGFQLIPAEQTTEADMISTTARDLLSASDFFKKAAQGNADVATRGLIDALQNVPAEMERAAGQLRQLPERYQGWQDYVVANWAALTTPMGCFNFLMECRQDPTFGQKILADEEGRVWLWDHLIALVRAKHNRDNDFGYSAMVAIFKRDKSDKALQALFKTVMGTLSGRALTSAQRWVNETLPKSAEPGRRGFQDWLAGSKDVSPVVIAAFAYALAETLKSVKSPASLDSKKILASHSYNLWNKLLTHQDFEPLPNLVRAAAGTHVERSAASSLMGEVDGDTVQDAGVMDVFSYRDGLIYWQSAHGSHVNDKRKELSGRARALRFSRVNEKFCARSSVKKLVLVLDGDWRDEDLRVLSESGWDEIFYPDEMSDLLKYIGK